ncbi:MAG: FtsQ-type POTRA domain-containing protein [Candidatus Cloacimonetes bacterium]|nr:FtsQ-type POTRA domain-containing protein [Candidatus Cloacimonadota bacterium]
MKRKRRGYSRFIFLGLLVIGLFSAVLGGFRILFQNLDFFQIENIDIRGNQNLEKEFLANLAKEMIGQNLFRISVREIEQKYENVIRIKEIKASRRLPNTLRITFQERKAIFYAKSKEGELFPIDKDKIVLDGEVMYPGEIVPVVETTLPAKDFVAGSVISDEFLDQVFCFYDQISDSNPEFMNRLSEFFPLEDEICMIEQAVGYKIILGENDLSEKIRRFTFVEKNRNFTHGSLIDLRFDNKLIVRTEEI